MKHVLLATAAAFALGSGVAHAQQIPRPEPQWTDYCKDFSEEACARIRKVVEAKVTPSYCKPGFAVVPTALSNEQLRICYVMPPLHAAAVPAPSQPRPQAAGVYPPDEIYRPSASEAYNHWTYCNWNRSGLPEAYQKICSKFDREKGASAERVLANASPALREYEATMTRASNNVYMAQIIVQVCRLRSNAWWTTILYSWQPFTVSEAKRLQLPAAETTAVLNKIELTKNPALVLEGPGNFCEKIVNSPVMDELDEMERKLTGNYH
jgi:hypothetical protein